MGGVMEMFDILIGTMGTQACIHIVKNHDLYNTSELWILL